MTTVDRIAALEECIADAQSALLDSPGPAFIAECEQTIRDARKQLAAALAAEAIATDRADENGEAL